MRFPGRNLRPSLFVSLLVALTVSGCADRVNVKRRAERRISGSLLVVPFSDTANYYYDSPGGNAVTYSVVGNITKNVPRVSLVDASRVRGLVRAAIIENNLSADTWATIGLGAQAEFVLHGSIDRITWTDPLDPGLPRCNFTVTYSLVDVSRRKILETWSKNGEYPPMMLADSGVTVYEMGLSVLKSRSYTFIGKAVARTFYDHKLTRFEVRSVRDASEGPAP